MNVATDRNLSERRIERLSESIDERPVFVVLLHSPMTDKQGKEVTTAVTNLDIHDIARSCKTFGVKRYYIVNPEPEQERMVKAILGHWHTEVSKVYHPARWKALEQVEFTRTFEEAFNNATLHTTQLRSSLNENRSGKAPTMEVLEGQSNEATVLSYNTPYVVMPDARDLSQYFKKVWGYSELRESFGAGKVPGDFSDAEKVFLRPVMVVFGTGWGIAPRFFSNVDCLLAPIHGPVRSYNHLSVRAAAAIVLDRLFGS
jgi:hypothetical protein